MKQIACTAISAITLVAVGTATADTNVSHSVGLKISGKDEGYSLKIRGRCN